MLASVLKFSRRCFSQTPIYNGRRKISKELTDEEYQLYLQNNRHLKTNKKPSNKAKNKLTRYESSNKTAAKNHNLPRYQTITGINDTTALNLTNLVSDLSKESFRKSNKLMLLNGNRSIQKALEFKDFVKTLYFTNENNLKAFPVEKIDKVKLVCISNNVKNKINPLLSDPVFALSSVPCSRINKIIRKRLLKLDSNNKKLLPITLLCCDTKNEVELGRLIKSASLLGCQKVITMSQCADNWSLQCMKAMKNTVFDIEIVPKISWPILEEKFNFRNCTILVVNTSGDEFNLEGLDENRLHEELSKSVVDVNNKTPIVKINSYKDIPWRRSQKYVIVLCSSVTRNIRAFVMENKFKDVLIINLETTDVNIAANKLLTEAKSNLL